jgi:AraC family transcriptional regulator
MDGIKTHNYATTDRKMSLVEPPSPHLPQWGQWLETRDLIVMVGQPDTVEANLRAPFHLISGRLQPGHGQAAFNSDRLRPYQSEPGGFDIVPQGCTYRSAETVGTFVMLAYKNGLISRITADYTDGEDIVLQPGQIAASTKGLHLTQSLLKVFTEANSALYLESLATLVLGHVLRERSQGSGPIKQLPDLLSATQVRTILDYIHDNLQEALRLEDLAQTLGLSSYYFAHAFRSTTGISPYQYLLRCRVERAKQLLQQSPASIAAIAYEVGFGSQSHMTTVFRKLLNVTPHAYRLDRKTISANSSDTGCIPE